MADIETLDKTFLYIIQIMAKTGVAPHYTEIATELSCPVEEGRTIVHETIEATLVWMVSGFTTFGIRMPHC